MSHTNVATYTKSLAMLSPLVLRCPHLPQCDFEATDSLGDFQHLRLGTEPWTIESQYKYLHCTLTAIGEHMYIQAGGICMGLDAGLVQRVYERVDFVVNMLGLYSGLRSCRMLLYCIGSYISI
jgi:hypothetical protein